MYIPATLNLDRAPTVRAWFEVDGYRWNWSEDDRPTAIRILCDPVIRRLGPKRPSDGPGGFVVIGLAVGTDGRLDRKVILKALREAIVGLNELDPATIQWWREDFDLTVGEVETIDPRGGHPVPRRLLKLWADAISEWSCQVLEQIGEGDHGSDWAELERTCA